MSATRLDAALMRLPLVLQASAEELLHLVIEEAAKGAVPELRAACPSVACSAVEAWMTLPGPEGKGEDPATAAFRRLGQRVFCGSETCQFENALRIFERQQQQPSQAGPLPPGADVCEGDDESPACWRHWLPLPHKVRPFFCRAPARPSGPTPGIQLRAPHHF